MISLNIKTTESILTGSSPPFYYRRMEDKCHESDDTVKSSRCKAHESLGTRRTQVYVGVTKDEVQRSRWTFYEVVKSS